MDVVVGWWRREQTLKHERVLGLPHVELRLVMRQDDKAPAAQWHVKIHPEARGVGGGAGEVGWVETLLSHASRRRRRARVEGLLERRELCVPRLVGATGEVAAGRGAGGGHHAEAVERRERRSSRPHLHRQRAAHEQRTP